MHITFLTIIILLLFIPAISISAHTSKPPSIESEAAILIEANTGEIIYEKEAEKRMYPASITKIITGIIALEEGDLKETVKISKNATEVTGTSVYLLEDEEMSLEQLVKGLLINSGNDAGTAIAEHLAETEDKFAARMNEFVQTKIGVEQSNFTNPHGLHGEEHYTTAKDMALISQYAMENEDFKRIVSMKEFDWEGEGWETVIYNHHRLLWDYKNVTGIKNGFVSQSGFTLSTSAEQEGIELIAVTLKAPTAQVSYQDTIKLLDYGFEQTSKYFTQLDIKAIDLIIEQRRQLGLMEWENKGIQDPFTVLREKAVSN